MGDRGPAYSVNTLSSCADDLHIGGFWQVVYTRDSLVTWSANIHNIGSGSQIYDSFLEEFLESHGDTIDDVHSLSSLDGWSVKEDYPDFGGHAMGMHPGS